MHLARLATHPRVLYRPRAFLAHRDVLPAAVYDLLSRVVASRGHRAAHRLWLLVLIEVVLGRGQDLGPVAPRVLAAGVLIVDVDAPITFHYQPLALLAAGLNDARRPASVAVTAHGGRMGVLMRVVYRADVVLGAGARQPVLEPLVPTCPALRPVDLVQRWLDEATAALTLWQLRLAVMLVGGGVATPAITELGTVDARQVGPNWVVCVEDLGVRIPILVDDVQVGAGSAPMVRATPNIVPDSFHPSVLDHPYRSVVRLPPLIVGRCSSRPLIHVLLELL